MEASLQRRVGAMSVSVSVSASVSVSRVALVGKYRSPFRSGTRPIASPASGHGEGDGSRGESGVTLSLARVGTRRTGLLSSAHELVADGIDACVRPLPSRESRVARGASLEYFTVVL